MLDGLHIALISSDGILFNSESMSVEFRAVEWIFEGFSGDEMKLLAETERVGASEDRDDSSECGRLGNTDISVIPSMDLHDSVDPPGLESGEYLRPFSPTSEGKSGLLGRSIMGDGRGAPSLPGVKENFEERRRDSTLTSLVTGLELETMVDRVARHSLSWAWGYK